VRSIPIVAPATTHAVGLVVSGPRAAVDHGFGRGRAAMVKTLEQPSPSPWPGDASVPDPNRDVGSKAKKPKGKNLAHPPPSR
jgi:hypothetical protein